MEKGRAHGAKRIAYHSKGKGTNKEKGRGGQGGKVGVKNGGSGEKFLL